MSQCVLTLNANDSTSPTVAESAYPIIIRLVMLAMFGLAMFASCLHTSYAYSSLQFIQYNIINLQFLAL